MDSSNSDTSSIMSSIDSSSDQEEIPEKKPSKQNRLKANKTEVDYEKSKHYQIEVITKFYYKIWLADL